MNFQTEIVLLPLKVLVVNPLTPSGQMILTKILSGFVFGENQLIDLTLLVYSNEKPIGERLKLDLIHCAYPCYNTITVSSDLPSISDADVFCFLSNFYNLNKIELDKMDTDDQFDALYLLIKVANNFVGLTPEKKESVDDGVKFKKKSKLPQNKPRKPIFMADGLAAMDILMSLSKNIPQDIFFCPTTIPDVAKSVLGEHLKVKCSVINDVLVWGANDEVFHVEVDKPIIRRDTVDKEFHCDDDMAGKEMYRSFDLDHTQFSPSWMKKEFIEKVPRLLFKANDQTRIKYKCMNSDGKVTSMAAKNPYGCIFRAAMFTRALKTVWTARRETGKQFYCNLGVVSDGSLGTTKGYSCILPVILSGDSWSVNTSYEETAHVKNELKRINKTVKQHHQMLIPFCKRFLQENVINKAFIPVESSTVFTSRIGSSKTSI